MCNDQLGGISSIPSLGALPANDTIPNTALDNSFNPLASVASSMSQLMQQVFSMGQHINSDPFYLLNHPPTLGPLSSPQDMMSALQSMSNGSGTSLGVPQNLGYPNPYGANGTFGPVAAGSLDNVGSGPLGAGNNGSTGGGWTAADNNNISAVMGAGNGTFSTQDVQSTFGQTAEGNCASVAVIKAAMEQYGNQMFKSVQSDGSGGYNVTLQDGQQVQVSQQDLATAAQMGQFKGNGGAAQSFATLAFAVEGKNAAQQGWNGQHSLQGALSILDKGAYVQQPAQLLGLSQDLVSIPVSQINGQNGVIGVSSDHAINIGVGASGQEIADHYGTATAYNGTDTRGGQLQGAFELKPLNGQLPPGAAAAPAIGSSMTTGPSPMPSMGGGMGGGAPMAAAPMAAPPSAPAAPASAPASDPASATSPKSSGSSTDWDSTLSSDASAASSDLQDIQSGSSSNGALDQLQADLSTSDSSNANVSDYTIGEVNEVLSAAASMSG